MIDFDRAHQLLEIIDRARPHGQQLKKLHDAAFAELLQVQADEPKRLEAPKTESVTPIRRKAQ